MKLADVIKFILDGSDSDVTAIHQAIQARKERANIALRCSLVVGQSVWFNEKTKPRYMIGLKATVKKINRERVLVDMADGPTGRFSKSVTVPLSLLSTTEV